ncbi:uncharacterized protein V1510DRAFT_355986, partial [Dipodascopsis tothii]|uniref:uncharacterized protein n=1 Tax=Dipodascopsis tothii TaxID=44089 RepID=UPI0034CE8B86
PVSVQIKNGAAATLFAVFRTGDELVVVEADGPRPVSAKLVELLHTEFNAEVERGQTYPQDEPYTLDGFRDYWFAKFVSVLVLGTASLADDSTPFEDVVLGSHYIKPNYAGRCSHLCNAGFLVSSRHRGGLGVGKVLGRQYLVWAPLLGYDGSVFNLVFVTNVASWKIWDDLGFTRAGLIKGAGKLKGHDEPVDAIVFTK